MSAARHISGGHSLSLLVVFLSACGGTQFVPIRHYALEPPLDVERRPGSDLTLAVRPLDYVRFYKLPMVYRTEGHTVGYLAYDQWAELPRDAVTRALVDTLGDSGLFADVGYAGELALPDLVLGGEIRRFDQARVGDAWTAEFEVRLELRERLGNRLYWAETLRASEPLDAHGPEDFAKAMSRAVATVIREAVERMMRDAG